MKVMSVPDSRCIQMVTPDDHVNIRFHDIIIYDIADEELPFVTLMPSCRLAKDFVYIYV